MVTVGATGKVAELNVKHTPIPYVKTVIGLVAVQPAVP
jgi:hypothetical protein